MLGLTRVAFHGWSLGGFLAAAAVLRRPAVFHAAVAGTRPPGRFAPHRTGRTSRPAA
ncbi:prolyl oligopeptidase family serine peptidase [Nonomuraea sp. MG754425]|uniref:prolyl oligopeptidase family serine peptidase n=1 Tax=Nonomuraea sp. MG754425 TaxID=2570319 RepID=UPI001F3097F2|nr:prolyl oligopeptidase family serine peptidase [Nonomuraea sp. MG754425]